MKKIFGLLLVVVLCGLFTFSFAQAQVESGTWGVNRDTPGYTLDKNKGDRVMTVNVSFDNPFDVKPDIVLGVTMLDANQKTAVRYDITAMSISRDGFTIQIKTWSETEILGIGGYWLAVAPAGME
jgi:hypothetical protein